MTLDITLKSNDKRIIIDTKFYKNALVTHHDKQMVRPDHLYQLFAYVKNDAKDEDPQRFDGICFTLQSDIEPLIFSTRFMVTG